MNRKPWRLARTTLGAALGSLLLIVSAVTATAQAQTLRWSSSGDPLTMDPHSQNELMTNIMNAQVYERACPPAGSRSPPRCGASSCAPA